MVVQSCTENPERKGNNELKEDRKSVKWAVIEF